MDNQHEVLDNGLEEAQKIGEDEGQADTLQISQIRHSFETYIFIHLCEVGVCDTCVQEHWQLGEAGEASELF